MSPLGNNPSATTLAIAISSGATAVTPTSVSGLQAPCYIVIGIEIILCPTSAVNGTFTGVTRGALDTLAASHAQFVPLYGLYSDLYPYSSGGEFLDAIAAELGAIEARLAGGGGSVTSVTGTAPIVSSGGANPAISITPATSAALGSVQPDGTIITVASGLITVPKASSSAFGVVEVDGTTITAAAGVISAVDKIGGVNSKVGNYLVTAADDGKIISVDSAATVTITLPNPPSATFKVFVQNIGTGLVHVIGSFGIAIDGVSGNYDLAAGAFSGNYFSTDGTNYFTTRGSVLPATSTTLGGVIPDGTIITVSGTGAITVPKASSSAFGVVEVDGTTITAAAGVISAVDRGTVTSVTGTAPIVSSGGATPAISITPATSAALGSVQPDGTIITVASGLITVPKASSSAFGVVEVDGTTITAAAGVISAVEPKIGGVNSQTVSYNVVAGDDGKIISMTSASITTVTMPNPPPSATFKVFVQNLGAALVHIAFNGLLIDNEAPSTQLNLATGGALQGVYLSTDGTNYFSSRAKSNVATTTSPGVVIPDGTVITVNASGNITVPAATSSAQGVVQPDGTIITVAAGAITVAKASSSAFGVVEVDGTTITSAAGVISAAGITEVASINLTAQTAGITAAALWTPAATGLFRVSWYAKVTTPGSLNSILGGSTGTLILAYTDGGDSVAQTAFNTTGFSQSAVSVAGTGNNFNTTQTVSQGNGQIYAKTGVAVTYTFGYTSTAANTMTYELRIRVEAL